MLSSAGCATVRPISLGYFAVAISLGIAARGAGLTAFQAALASLLNNASAGEFAAFTLIGAGAGYLEVALMTLVANARYLLMSLRAEPDAGRFDAAHSPAHHRL